MLELLPLSLPDLSKPSKPFKNPPQTQKSQPTFSKNPKTNSRLFAVERKSLLNVNLGLGSDRVIGAYRIKTNTGYSRSTDWFNPTFKLMNVFCMCFNLSGFWPNLGGSRWPYIQFCMQKPNLRSKNLKSGVQRPKFTKFEF